MAQHQCRPLIRTRTILVILLAIASWQSRPDLEEFLRFRFGSKDLQSIPWDALPQQLRPEVTDFGFFSVAVCSRPASRSLGEARVEKGRTLWFGLFGRWWELPALAGDRSGSDADNDLSCFTSQ